MKKNKVLTLGIMFPIFAISIIFLMSCKVEPVKPLLYPERSPSLAYNFNYTPVKEVSSLTATIALLSPMYSLTPKAGSEDIRRISNAYLNSLKSDFEETLIAKGYSIAGPYTDLEVMTYIEKEKAILALVPNITIEYRFEYDPTPSLFSEGFGTGTKELPSSDGTTTHYFRRKEEIFETNGIIIVNGRIELVLYEPITKEKMWIKKIEIPPEEQPCRYYKYKSTYVWKDIIGLTSDTRPGIEKIIPNGDTRRWALAKALESAYVAQLKKFSDYFHPREIAQVIKSAEKLRKK